MAIKLLGHALTGQPSYPKTTWEPQPTSTRGRQDHWSSQDTSLTSLVVCTMADTKNENCPLPLGIVTNNLRPVEREREI